MSKLDRFKRSEAHVRESMGADRTPAAPAGPPPAAADPRFDGLRKVRNVAEIEVDRIARDENQPREEFPPEGLERLAQSLRSRGQLQPIRVRWEPGQHNYIIIAGERRWRAAKLAGLPTVTAVVHDGEMSETETRAVQLIENLIREDLRPIEQAKAFRGLMELEGWTATRVGEEIGVAQPTVTRALKLLELPEGVQEKVEQGALSAAAAYEVSKLDDPEEQAAVAEQIVAGKITRDETRHIINEKKGRGKGGKGRAVFRTRDVVWTAQGSVEDPEKLRASLLEVLGQIEVRRAG